MMSPGRSRLVGHFLAALRIQRATTPAPSRRRILHGQQAIQDAFGVQLLLGRQGGVDQQHAAHQDRIQRRAEQRAGQRAGGQQRGDRVRQVAAHLVRRNRGRAPHDATVAACSTRTGGSLCHHADDLLAVVRRAGGAAAAAPPQPAGACQSWPVSGSGSGSRKIFAPARNPNHRLATMPTLTDAELRPGTPGININAPIAEAEADSRTALSVAARAAGSACNTRQAPVRSYTNTSAAHGGGCSVPEHADRDVGPVRGPHLRRGQQRHGGAAGLQFRDSRRHRVVDRRCLDGYSWSNPCARERNPSSSREKTRGCDRRASVSTAAANGSRTGLISASPALPAPGISASLCHPGFRPSLSSAARTASQAWARANSPRPERD